MEWFYGENLIACGERKGPFPKQNKASSILLQFRFLFFSLKKKTHYDYKMLEQPTSGWEIVRLFEIKKSCSIKNEISLWNFWEEEWTMYVNCADNVRCLLFNGVNLVTSVLGQENKRDYFFSKRLSARKYQHPTASISLFRPEYFVSHQDSGNKPASSLLQLFQISSKERETVCSSSFFFFNQNAMLRTSCSPQCLCYFWISLGVFKGEQ